MSRRHYKAQPIVPIDEPVVIEKIVQGGLGLARTERGVVFVEDGLPGDRGHLIELKRKRGSLFARLRLSEATRFHRVQPDCSVYETCGGCDFLDVSAHDRLELKKEIFLDQYQHQLRRFQSEILDPEDISFFEHRDAGVSRRVRLHVDAEGRLGYYARGTHDVVEFETCLRLEPKLNHVIDALKEQAIPTHTDISLLVNKVGQVTLAISERESRFDMETWLSWCESLVAADVVMGASVHEPDGKLMTCAGDIDLSDVLGLPEQSGVTTQAAFFAQGTHHIASEMVRLLAERLEAIRQQMERPVDVVELYCGSGELTLPLSSFSRSWHAYEGHPGAVDILKRNIATAELGDMVQAHESFIDGRTFELNGVCADVVISDPPRKGMLHLNELLSRWDTNGRSPKHWLHVSCDAATGLRDIRHLLEQGYRLNALHVLDAFPRTQHMELVAFLTRTS